MHNSDRSHNIRRIAGILGILLSLLIILGVGAFTTRAGIISSIPGIPGAPRPTSPGFITTKASACNTPSHQPGDSNLSIRSAGLTRTFIVHLAPTYGTQPQPVVINYHG